MSMERYRPRRPGCEVAADSALFKGAQLIIHRQGEMIETLIEAGDVMAWALPDMRPDWEALRNDLMTELGK